MSLINLLKPAQKICNRTLRFIPFPIQKLVLEKALSELFVEAVEDGDVDFLQDMSLHIFITDIPLHWIIGFEDSRFKVMPVSEGNKVCDATISGELSEFVLLATRSEDPDTLFFQRRLAIEGNTEIGLAVKNLLDSIDFTQFPSLIQQLVKKVGKAQQYVNAHASII